MQVVSKLANCFRRFWSYLFLTLILILTIASLLYSEEFELYRDIEHLLFTKDHPFLLLLSLGLVFALIVIHSKHSEENVTVPNVRTPDVGKYMVMFISALLSLFFLLTLRSQPYMDCINLIETADQFRNNDYSSLLAPEHNSYMFIYSFQIGMVLVLECLFRILGSANYFAFQLLNVIAAVIMTRNVHELAKLIFKDEDTVRLADIFLCLCLPLFINVTFVYGDVIGWSFAVGALLCTMRWVSDKQLRHLIIAAILIAAGIQIKSNDYIFLIAILLIIFCEVSDSHQWRALLCAALCAMLPFLLSSCIKSFYANRAGIESFPQGTPASCWIAMSIIEDKDFEDGWYNGYNITTFRESGYDRQIADQVARAKIAERIDTFIHHPKYTIKFFGRKLISAWNEPQFNSQIKMEWSTRHVENLSPVAKWMIEGSGRRVLFHIMNVLHFIIFAGTLIWMIVCLRSRDNELRRTSYLILPVLGGMMFHLLWETQSRYMIVYYILLFPAAAAGIATISKTLGSRLASNY